MNIFTKLMQLLTRPVPQPQERRYRVEPRGRQWVMMDGERPTIFRFPTKQEAQAFADHFNEREQKTRLAQATA